MTDKTIDQLPAVTPTDASLLPLWTSPGPLGAVSMVDLRAHLLTEYEGDITDFALTQLALLEPVVDDAVAAKVAAEAASTSATAAKVDAEAAEVAAVAAAGSIGTAVTDAQAAQAAASVSASDAASSAASATATVATIGHPVPTATGSALGLTTYIFDNPAPADCTATLLRTAALASGGNVKIKLADIVSGAWVLTDVVTKTVAAGVVDSSLAFSIKKGQRLAFYGGTFVSQVGNGGPLTPYYTLAGDVLSGSIGALVSNQSIQLGFRVQFSTTDSSTKLAAADQRTTDVRTRFAGLADTDLGSSLSSATAYFDPRPLTPGVPAVLSIHGRTAGWATVLLAQRSGETQHDIYRAFDVYLDVGKNVITYGSAVIGKTIPRDVVILPDTIYGMVCPSSAGQVAWTATDGPGTSGENIIGYRLPIGNFTTASVKGGVQTFTWSNTSNRQLACEWVINEIDSPRKRGPQRRDFLNVTFSGTTLPASLQFQGTSPTFAAGYALSPSGSVGFGNVLRARFGNAFNDRIAEVDQEFVASDAVAMSGFRSLAGNYGSAASADLTANSWKVYVQHGAGTTTPAVTTTRTWPGTFTTSSKLRWRWERTGRYWKVTLSDLSVQPVVSDSYLVDATAADIPPLVTNPSDSLSLMGQMNGFLQSGALAGQIRTTRMWEPSPKRAITGLIIGDSITNASRVAESQGWAQQLSALRSARGQQTAIMAVDGWDMTNGAEAVRQAVQLLPDLEWVLVALGTNRGASSGSDPRDKNMFEAAAAASLLELQGRGIAAYFLAPAPHTFSPGATTSAQRVSYLQGTAWKLIRADKAVTQADGVAIDTSMFYNSGSSDVHFNAAGHAAVLKRVIHDAPELLY